MTLQDNSRSNPKRSAKRQNTHFNTQFSFVPMPQACEVQYHFKMWIMAFKGSKVAIWACWLNIIIFNQQAQIATSSLFPVPWALFLVFL